MKPIPAREQLARMINGQYLITRVMMPAATLYALRRKTGANMAVLVVDAGGNLCDLEHEDASEIDIRMDLDAVGIGKRQAIAMIEATRLVGPDKWNAIAEGFWERLSQ